MEPNSNPFLRFAIGLVAVAVAIQVAWQLIQPALPFLGAVTVAVLGVRFWIWYRDRY